MRATPQLPEAEDEESFFEIAHLPPEVTGAYRRDPLSVFMEKRLTPAEMG